MAESKQNGAKTTQNKRKSYKKPFLTSLFTVAQIWSILGLENQTPTVTRTAERCEELCGSGTPKKFRDLLIFCEKRIETLGLQWLDAGMGFAIIRSGVVHFC